MLHDPGGTFGTKNTLVDGMVLVSLDIFDLAILHMHVDAAAAGAHVAGRLADFVRNLRAWTGFYLCRQEISPGLFVVWCYP